MEMNIIDRIAALQDSDRSSRSWASNLSDELVREITEMVDNWIAGGVCRKKLPTKAAMWRFLCGTHEGYAEIDAVFEPGKEPSASAWYRFVSQRESETNGPRGKNRRCGQNQNRDVGA